LSSSRSRFVAAVLLLGPGSVSAQSVTAEEALKRYETLTTTEAKRCQSRMGTGEILVCGQQRSKYLLPLPEEREARDGPRRATGEIPSSLPPKPPCPPTGCTGINLFKVIGIAAKIKEAIDDSND
jgi:hypothetical protein